MAELALVILIMIARPPSAIIIRELCKNKDLFLTGPGNYIAHLGPHSEVVGKDCARARAAAFIGVEGGGLGFHRLTLYW